MTLKRSPMRPGKPMARTAFKQKAPAPGAGLLRVAAVERKARKAMKSRGMKGRTPTADEKRFMDAITTLGCIACAKDGIANSHISIHHIAGRTAPGAHFLVLPLCEFHHQQDDTDPLGRISVHGNKVRFEARYGTQMELLAEAKSKLSETGKVAAAPASEQIHL